MRVDDRRYLVGIAVVDDRRLVEELSLPGPADEDEAGQLGELYAWTADLVADRRPDIFALRSSEVDRRTANAVVAHRAEGILLAAAGRSRSVEVSEWSRQRLAKPAGAGSQKAADIRAALCTQLDGEPSSPQTTEAACAAIGALVSAG